MDYNAVIQAIGSVGFPIVASIGLFYLYNITIKEITTTLAKINATLERLVSRLDKDEREV